LPAPYAVDINLHAIRIREDKERWRGSIGTVSLGAGQTRGNTIITSFTTGIGENYVEVYYSGEYKGQSLYCDTDSTVSETITATYVSGDMNNATHHMYCDIDLIPRTPTASGGCSLGNPIDKWYNIYAVNLKYDNDLSDKRVKNSIETLPIEYENFYNLIRPVRYKYNNGTSNRYHTGFIAQELVHSIEEVGLSTQDFAGVVLDSPG
jgi:hypothetical protein